MTFLRLEDKTFVVLGVSNKKSVGFHCGRVLEEEGARVVYVAHTDARRAELRRVLPDRKILVCDVAERGQIDRLGAQIAEEDAPIDGFVHSIAFARYAEGLRPFHDTGREDALEAFQISCHSLVELASALKSSMTPDASVVALSISTTRMAAENYGYMAPIKAALDSTVVFLAKSFSAFSRIRFNTVNAGLLKTRSSAGIPGYVDSYLFAEQATLRKKGLATREVADAVAFLLSSRSSGINAQHVVVDAGMSVNYFDREIVRGTIRGPKSKT